MTERFKSALPDVPPANDTRAETEPLTCVYLRMNLPDGSQEGPYRVSLNAHGEADLSELPKEIADRLARGVEDGFRQGIKIMPGDGAPFLGVLLQTGGVYGASCSRKE